ncbi:carboxypeptidase-like regulatory domain-containing protein [Hymenobacter sp. 15J16-1T3B]|uniref:carboxypeptidase-like regulatory domain-containing protein n=1 Tax=Hymenobacter sp. 15J16-1T3B TaxID=2886941 RepID=UPI001D120EDF|nr:carboxypeptidase-like regulatory domain-containing protein [Hymenobacter sp. 15J16-1T3B]MCC3155984.1 carboxypeptidase-like regulatory domain-containing protein [Hymenobacter sp. 15J16-1T3B]
MSSFSIARAAIRCLLLPVLPALLPGFLAGAAAPGAVPTALVARPGTCPPDTTAYRLRGRLLDAYTQEPLPAATLWLRQLALGTFSDEQGYFSFELTADQLATNASDTLQVRASAFRPHAVPITFLQRPADSLLRLSLQRDSLLVQPKPLPVLPRREVRRLSKAPARPVPRPAAP